MTDSAFDNIKVKFEQFLALVGNILVHEKEIYLIQNKIRRHFNTTSSSYLCSKDFQLLFNHIHNLFNKNEKSTKYFTLLNSLDVQLKKHSIKSTGSHQSLNEAISSIQNIELVKANEKPVITSCKCSTIDEVSAKEISDQPLNEELKITTNSINISKDEKKRKKIHKLERILSNLSKVIRELEEKDLSLDEMRHSDLYVVESNLKKRAYDIYIKLAELKNQPSSVERILDRPVTLTETEIDHPLINKALEDMVNQTKFLPSFDDVLDTVDKTNDQYELKLSADVRQNLAEKSFKIIGTKVKERRMADFNDIMNSRLPEDFDIERNDPALNSVEIENTLLENEREALSKTEKIFEEFSHLDTDMEPEINVESSEEENNDDDEEEEDDDDGDETDSKSEMIVETVDNKHDENHYDAVDILPPFSPKFSSSSPLNITETTTNKDPVESTVEISLVNQSTFRILHKASIPVKKAVRHPFVSIVQEVEPEVYTITDDDDPQESQHISIIQEHKVHTIIPRRRQQQQHTSTNAVNETLYSIYTQQITDLSTAEKRSSKDIDCSDRKKRKEESEIVIID